MYRREATGAILLKTGGVWDNLERCYTDEEPGKAAVINVKESQVPFFEWYARWLEAYENNAPRKTRIVLTAGQRRGGKTTAGVLAMIAMCVCQPNRIVWAVSPSFEKRDELDNEIAKLFPKSWYIYRGQPKYRYIFDNGSVLRHISSDDPDALKQGKVDLVMLNEAQLQASTALTNALPGTIDRGGLVLLAANPATRAIGIWVNDLKEAHDTKKVNDVKFFAFDPKLNSAIDQSARSAVGDILRVVDPKVAAADDEGLWLPVGDVAYPRFTTATHAKRAPALGDITGETLKKRYGRAFDFVMGADFQAVPHMATVALKVFRDLDGSPIYWAVGETVREGTEEDLLDAVDAAGIWSPENSLVIGDASGTWQDGAHKRGRNSFDIFKARRWNIQPPRKAKDDSRNPKNPPVEDRVSLVNNLLARGRLFVDPEKCPRLAIALKKCELKNHKPRGKYAHITDALGYALYWLEPKPQASKGGVGSASVPDAKPKGPDW